MPTLNSETKAARIRAEDLEKLNPVLEEISFSEWVHRQINSTSVNVPVGIIKDFEVILGIYDTNFNDFFKALYRKVESGEIDVDEVMK